MFWIARMKEHSSAGGRPEGPGLNNGSHLESSGCTAKRVFMISFNYPPPQSTGAIRAEKLAKYLPEFGWEPTVLTAATPGHDGLPPGRGQGARVIRARYFDIYAGVQRLLKLNPRRDTLEQLKKVEGASGSGVAILKRWLVPGIARLAKNWIAFPDKAVPWLPFALLEALRELRRGSYDVIYSTTPPTGIILGFLLKKAFGLPWIIDYQDAWSVYMLLRGGRFRGAAEKWLERTVVAEADYIVAVSGELLDLQRELVAVLSGTAVVTNGFDPEDFEGIDVKPQTDMFVLTYTGILYGFRRDPWPVLAVLDRLAAEGMIREGDCIVRFYSDCELELEKLLDRMKNKWLMEIAGMVDHDEALLRQKESTALLNLMLDDPLSKLGHGSKIFEYMGSGRPILTWSPVGGPIEDLVRETGGGEIARNESELSEILVRWVSEFKEGGCLEVPRNERRIEEHTHRSQTGLLAGALDELVSSDGRQGRT